MTEANIKQPRHRNTNKEEINIYEILFKYLAYWPWFIAA